MNVEKKAERESEEEKQRITG